MQPRVLVAPTEAEAPELMLVRLVRGSAFADAFGRDGTTVELEEDQVIVRVRGKPGDRCVPVLRWVSGDPRNMNRDGTGAEKAWINVTVSNDVSARDQ